MAINSNVVSIFATLEAGVGDGRGIVIMGFNGVYIALADCKRLLIWPVDATNLPPNVLLGHESPIVGLCFGIGTDVGNIVMCTSDMNQINVWTIGIGGVSENCDVIPHDFGPHDGIKICPNDANLAVTTFNVVHVFPFTSAEQYGNVSTLAGHESKITAVEFSFFYTNILVTTSEDRTYIVWNYIDGTVLYQSSINVLSPFSCIAVDPNADRVAIGAANGQITVINTQNFTNPQYLDLGRSLRRDSVDFESFEYLQLLNLFFTMKPTMPPQLPITMQKVQNRQGVSSSCTDELLEWPPLLVAGMSTGCALYHALTFEKLFYADFSYSSFRHFENTRRTTVIQTGISYQFMDLEESLQLWCLLSENKTLNDRESTRLHLLMFSHPYSVSPEDSLTCDDDDGLAELSVASTTAPMFNSPLRANCRVARKPTVMAARANLGKNFGRGKQLTSLVGSSKSISKPVTFKETIKSSGYGPKAAGPPRKMFVPQTSFGKKSAVKVAPKKVDSNSDEVKQYPVKSDPPVDLKVSIDADPTYRHPLTTMEFSPNGKILAASSANKIVHLFPMPLTGKGSAVTGHNGAVRSVNWSLDSSRIITASDDKTVRIWNSGGDNEQCLRIDNGGSTQKPGAKFEKEISWASLFYNDELALLTSSKSLYAFSYLIDMTKVSDIKTYENKCRFMKVHQVDFKDCAYITAASAPNLILSNYVFIATSAKSLHIYDMNHCKVARAMEDCHERAVHCIKHNQGSLYNKFSDSLMGNLSYNIFATAAVCDGIKLWDIRQKRCVRKFGNHCNKFHSCGFAWSSCGRYIAASSEDRSAYLYDVTASTNIHKYSKLSDIGCAVSFHPLYPEVALCFNDGKISLFSSRSTKTTGNDKRKGGAKTPSMTHVEVSSSQSGGGSRGAKEGVSTRQEQYVGGTGDTVVMEGQLTRQRSSAVTELL